MQRLLSFHKRTLGLNKKAFTETDFFDLYGASLLSDEYLAGNPDAKQYRDFVVNQFKEEFIQKYEAQQERFKEEIEIGHPKEFVNQVEAIFEKIVSETNPKKLITLIDTLFGIYHHNGAVIEWTELQIPDDIYYLQSVKFSENIENLIPRMSEAMQEFVKQDVGIDRLKRRSKEQIAQDIAISYYPLIENALKQDLKIEIAQSLVDEFFEFASTDAQLKLIEILVEKGATCALWDIVQYQKLAPEVYQKLSETEDDSILYDLERSEFVSPELKQRIGEKLKKSNFDRN